MKERIWAMQNPIRISWIAIMIGIATMLILYIFFAHSPYVLGAGCVLGVALARISSLKSAAIHGAIIAIPLGVYVNLVGSAGSSNSPTTLSKSLSILLFAVVGGILGYAFVWVKNQLSKGTTFYS
jgi:hypothetical protein